MPMTFKYEKFVRSYFHFLLRPDSVDIVAFCANIPIGLSVWDIKAIKCFSQVATSFTKLLEARFRRLEEKAFNERGFKFFDF